MKKITTLEQLQNLSDENQKLIAPNWRDGIEKPLSWFLNSKVKTLIAIMESGLFVDEDAASFGPVRLITHDTSTDLLTGTKDMGYVVGEVYQCVGKRNMDGYDYVLICHPDKEDVWAGADQVHAHQV